MGLSRARLHVSFPGFVRINGTHTPLAITPQTRLRVLSANLWNGGADPRAFADLVTHHAPDVVAVQELGEAQAQALRLIVPHGVFEPDDDFFGMGIGLRHPGHVWRLPSRYRDPRITEITVIASDGTPQPVEVIKVHVQPRSSLQPWDSFQNRRGQLRELERYLDAYPVRRRVIVGDLNSTPIWPW